MSVVNQDYDNLEVILVDDGSDDETQKMLKLSGNRELYARDERDALILFSLQQKKTIMETNELLFSHSLKVLGTSED